MALVVVVPGAGGPGGGSRPGGQRSFGPLSVGPLSAGPLSTGPLSVGSASRRTDPVHRVVAALSSSVRAARGPVPRTGDVVLLDFADLFAERPCDDAAPSGEAEQLAEELLCGWWTAATRIGRFEAQTDRRRRPAQAAQRPSEPGGEPAAAAAYCAALGTSPYFRGSPELAGAEAWTLSRYLTDLKLRHEVRDRTLSAILPDTRVIIAHGLGALVAYEALCALSDAVSVSFVSLGAAMCGPQQVFTRLEPAPRNGQGQWPAAIRRWSNVVAHSDPTSMIAPQLTDRFGPGIEDEVVEIKSSCGELYPYLLDRVVGRAVAAGLGVYPK
ncbi:hypothetical protein KGA66_09510 [Actinocrinis puniceicyclus]|uniref:Uncharacterized protein n=1 Tax=Actinocrinis puniceicyclus TaxID=977794 RepID=A0A8J7WJA8_9ACTN|nr:hypothetical protein [Actinocrinis puniceicyclus]MBS2963281.1 hypothetical protein [Actinocrinis puniceicyclus]